MITVEFKQFGTSLGPRALGQTIRCQVSQEINSGNCIIFDFSGLEVISNSFADECFGKLVTELGLDNVKKKTTFRNTNEFISFVIKKAINNRLSNQSLATV